MLLTKYSQWSHFLLAAALSFFPLWTEGSLWKHWADLVTFQLTALNAFPPIALGIKPEPSLELPGASQGASVHLPPGCLHPASPVCRELVRVQAACLLGLCIRWGLFLAWPYLSPPLPLPFPDGQPWSISELLFHFPRILYFLYIHI